MELNKEIENNILSILVKKINLNKKQTESEVLIQKGSIVALERMILLLENEILIRYINKEKNSKSFKDEETSLKKYNLDEVGDKVAPETYSVLLSTKLMLEKERSVLIDKIALENLFLKLDDNLENTLVELDLLDFLESKSSVSKDVEIRMGTGLCALKRPGRVKFPCNDNIVEGEKYCKEHLKMFTPEKYFEKFDIPEKES